MQDDYFTIDAKISISHPDENWELSLIANNLTDEIFNITSGPIAFGGGGLFSDDRLVTQNRGRQVFIQAGFKF